MKKDKMIFRKDVAFINREKELAFLKGWITERPESILFLHGPKSSGKTTLLYRFLDQIQKEQKLDVRFLNLRKVLTEFDDEFEYHDFLGLFFQVMEGVIEDHDTASKSKSRRLEAGINVGFFKVSAEVEKKMRHGRVNPFKIIENEFIRLNERGIKPVLIIDELQALDKTYLQNGREKRLLIELLNFFVAMTKESHLAHIIIASSDGYFLNTVYVDSKLKKTSRFQKVDYLEKKDLMEWLLNLEKYSKIKDYRLTPPEVEKIWNTVGGSMWEIQDILTDLFDNPLDEVLAIYKKKMRGIIAHYCQFDRAKKQVLKVVNAKGTVSAEDFEDLEADGAPVQDILADMVKNNILYFDPIEAAFYPQGQSFRTGIELYLKPKT